VLVLMETWIEEKNWGKVKEKLTKGYRWEAARRKNKKGRTMGGMIMIFKKELTEQKEGGDMKEEGIIEGRIKEKGIRTVNGGDFNTRTGEEEGRVWIRGGR
ncbi:hypothetical protein ALC56_10585, partial [Trachymyrmex septentrionalis]